MSRSNKTGLYLPIVIISIASLGYMYFVNWNAISLVIVGPILGGIVYWLTVIRDSKQVFSVSDDTVVINGVFKKVTVAKEQLANLTIRTDFFCRVFDWNLISIHTETKDIDVYTREIPQNIFNTDDMKPD